MATITAGKIIEAGLTSSLNTCTSGGDEFTNTGVEFIRIQNTHASATHTVKIAASGVSNVKHPQYGTLTKGNIYKAVAPATNSAYIGPFKQGAFNDSSEKVQITYGTGTGTTDTTFNALNAISTISSGAHLLKIEVLYLDN